ncbi:MAG: hypothetical protein QNJ55_31825 [Xenococcus sp. MO_188.B8]|nr:hypothetical protein [Xenococcus sp. MO_188.B8]
MNNSVKSVSPSPSKSKASDQRQARKDSYREKFGNRPHMIIPQEDSEFIETQNPSTIRLWLQCWRSDPYGNRWTTLNHDLPDSSFRKAKKILADKGLFVFEPKKSMRDGRETAYWLVKNLHGARRNDFWINTDSQVNSDAQDRTVDAQDRTVDAQDRTVDAQDRTVDAQDRAPISIKTQAQQGLQNPSGGISGSSSVTPQRVTEEPGIESEAGDRRASPAFDERVSPAPPPDEKKKPKTNSLDKKSQINGSQENSNLVEDIPAPPEKNILLNNLEEDYVYDWRSTAAIGRAKAQNLAIEAQQKTEEYQSTSKDALTRIRANLARKKERMDAERRAKDWEASPMRLIDSQNVEELKREQEAERSRRDPLRGPQEKSLRNGRIVNRPAPEDYPDDW